MEWNGSSWYNDYTDIYDMIIRFYVLPPQVIKINSWIFADVTIPRFEFEEDIFGTVEIESNPIVTNDIELILEIEELKVERYIKGEVEFVTSIYKPVCELVSNIELEKEEFNNDIETDIELSEGKYNRDYRGIVEIENNKKERIIYTQIEYEKDDYNKDIESKILYKENKLKFDLSTRISMSREKYKKFIKGKVKYNKGYLKKYIKGNIYLDRRDKYIKNIISKIDLERELLKEFIRGKVKLKSLSFKKNKLKGRVEYETALLNKYLDGELELDEKEKLIKELEGELEYIENEGIKDLDGIVEMLLHYYALFFSIKFKVMHRKFYLCDFPIKFFTPPCIGKFLYIDFFVDDSNVIREDIINGDVEIEDYDYYEKDIIVGNVEKLADKTLFLDGEIEIEETYTRREFEINIEIIYGLEAEFGIDLEIVNREDEKYNKDIYSMIEYGEKEEFDIDINFDIIALADELNIITKPIPPYRSGRVVIVVSPLWRFEPKVFKSSLVTFLDRYYGLYDINLLYGGNPRADWDITNLALNYKIRKEKLHRVPILFEAKDPQFNRIEIHKFIKAMFEFPPYETNNIARVFCFMNNPQYYHNDVIAPIINTCKRNGISCVGITSDGTFLELVGYVPRSRIIINDRDNRMTINQYNIDMMDPDRITY